MPNEDIQKLKALAHPLRASIIKTLGKEKQPASIKRLAEIIGQKPTKLHYHFRLLEKAGFIEVAGTREINGITERFYRLTGLDPNIVLSHREYPEAVGDVYPLLEQTALEVIRRISNLDLAKKPVVFGAIKDLYFRSGEASLARDALSDLVAHKTARLPEPAGEESGEPYDLMVFLVPRFIDDAE